MPIHQNAFLTYMAPWGGGAMYSYSNKLGEILEPVSPYPPDINANTPGFTRGIQASNPAAIYEALILCIGNSDFARFEKLLKGSFFIKKLASVRSIMGTFSTPNGIGHGTWNHYEDWIVRPVLEDLFFNNTLLFHKLIATLLTKDDENFYNAFKNSLINTHLNREELLTWNANIRRDITRELMNIKQCGNLLHSRNAGNKQGARIVSIAEQLIASVEKKEIPLAASSRMQFENLQFKLDLLLTLYRKEVTDDTLKLQPGWKRFVFNFFSVLFNDICNGIQYIRTGHAFFYNKTKTDIAKIHDTIIGIDQSEKLLLPSNRHWKIQNATDLINPVVDIIEEMLSEVPPPQP